MHSSTMRQIPLPNESVPQNNDVHPTSDSKAFVKHAICDFVTNLNEKIVELHTSGYSINNDVYLQ